MKRTPSLLRIVKVDYVASLGVIFPLVMWGLALAAHFFDPEAAAFFRLLAPIVTVLGLALFLWRVWLIRQVFADGDETPGVLTNIGFFRGRGRAEYVYTYQSHKYQSSNAIQASATTRALAPGQAVTVMVHRLNPKRAFLRELYL
jgi:hypothetical protein